MIKQIRSQKGFSLIVNIIIVVFVISGIAGTYIVVRTLERNQQYQKTNQIEIEDAKGTIQDSGGFSKELKHISTDITETVEDILRDFPKDKCFTDSECVGVHGVIESTCVQCSDLKMIVGSRVFQGPKDYGLCEKTHMLSPLIYRNIFYEKSQMAVYYCIGDFSGVEFPTTSLNTKEYLEIWKEFVINSQNISEEYFNEHILLITADKSEFDKETFFSVSYYYNVDWVQVEIRDVFLIKREGETSYLTKDEIYSIPSTESGLKDRNSLGRGERIKEIKSVVSRKDVERIFKSECSSSMVIDERSIFLTDKGNLTLRGIAEISEDDSLTGRVDLETGELISCR